ncbi:MAG: ROK family protein [Actinomycetota bacterium]|nr:ROK family protein [Actinomycetota bacterium]
MPSTPRPPVVLAFDVGGTSVKAAALDSAFTVLAESRLPSTTGPAILDVIETAARDLLAALPPGRRADVVGAGIAMPGLVDNARGICLRSVNLDITDLEVAGSMSERLGLPVRVDHDVAVAGEAVHRAVPVAEDPFVVIVGTGVAAVTFVHGRAVRGISGQAGEFGHIVVRPGGPECRCGQRGCLETMAGAGAIVRAYEARTGERVDGARVVHERVPSDPVAAEVWGEAVSALADGLVTVCALLAPGAVLLGGGLSEAGDALTTEVEVLMRERSVVSAVPPILVTELGSRAGLVGAAHRALDAAAEAGA